VLISNLLRNVCPSHRFILWLCGLTLLLNSCLSLRLSYTGNVVTEDNKKHAFVYQDSVGTKLEGITCGLTAIFYGGTCWLFALMPYPSQREYVASMARDNLESRFQKTKFKLSNTSVEKYGYNAFANSPYVVLNPPVGENYTQVETADGSLGSEEDSQSEDSPSWTDSITKTPKISGKKRFSLYAALGAGTGLAPTVGLGPSIMMKFSRYMWTAGFLNSRSGKNNLGRHLSLSFVRLGKVWHWGAGYTNYYGSGKRTVRYQSGQLQKDVDAKWDINYAHLIVGTTIPTNTKGLWWRLDGGLSFGGGHVSANDGSDYSNLSAQGIQLDDPNSRFSALSRTGDAVGPGDWGPFVQVMLMYQLI